jgi:hypothetical protein
MNRPNSNQRIAASSANIWLAFGDETGSFDNLQSSSPHGAALILARPADLVAALNEPLNGQTIRQRMNRAVEGLDNWLIAQGSDKADELKKHHVREAWEYLNKQKDIVGEFPLGATSANPVLNNLLASFRWLADHPKIISLGIHGSAKEVLTDFWKGSDDMAAIGALYGTTLALVKPFLGTSPRIRMLAGRRAEKIDSPVIRRAGQSTGAPMPGSNRQTSSETGGNRTLLEAMETSFWEALSGAEDWWPVPGNPVARQTVFSGYMEKKAFVAALEKEDQAAAQLINGNENALNNLADLACSLMAASRDSSTRALRIRFPEPIGPNVRFFSVGEVQS